MSHNEELSDLKISIVGLGLMGGSMAKALSQQALEVMAVDPDRDSLDAALAEGTISSGTSDLEIGVSNADVIILAMPVRAIIETIPSLPVHRPQGCFVMDLGSTKEEIGDAMARLPETFNAIGGHPMCGREQSGYQAATPNLYDGQTFILCRNLRTNPAAEVLAERIIEAVNAQSLFVDADIHDEVVALTSHLPYLVATMLTSLVAEKSNNDARYWEISATGLRDATRLSGSNPHMMLDILSSNKQSIINQLKMYSEKVNQLIQYLERDDFAELGALLQSAAKQNKYYLESRWNEPSQNHSAREDK